MGNVPRIPRALGLAGLLPQLACVLAAAFGPEDWSIPAQLIGAAYAGLILSFLGGMWWGIAASAPQAQQDGNFGWVWVAAVLPSLIALACLLPWVFGWSWPGPSLIMLGGTLIASLGVDVQLRGLAPSWWMQLRVPLSAVLGIATVVLAFI